jgi:hypothetical protein
MGFPMIPNPMNPMLFISAKASSFDFFQTWNGNYTRRDEFQGVT